MASKSRRSRAAKGLISRRWFDRALGAGLMLGAVGLVRAVREELAEHADTPSATLGLAWLPEPIARHQPHILRASTDHGVDARLIAIIILVESRGRPLARSRVGACGLMQVMPNTARDIAKRRGLDAPTRLELFAPATNIDYGSWYLARQLERFEQPDSERTIELAAAAYNGGPRRVRRHLEKGRKLPRETRAYMQRVGDLWRERDARHSATLAEMWPSQARAHTTSEQA